MKQITNFIKEGLRINKNTITSKDSFTDEELMDDYERVTNAFSKSDKEPFMIKYDCDINKIRDIQLVILDKLRENRQNKKEFDDKDIRYFCRFDMPWGRYEKLKTYLDQEPKEFLQYVLQYYEQKCKKIHPYRRSIADNHTLKIRDNLKKYLGK